MDKPQRVFVRRTSNRTGEPEWREMPITGETSRSWIAGEHAWQQLKIPKKGRNVTLVCFTPEEVERATWVTKHAWRIGDAVGRVTDFDTLIHIATLAGYKERA